MNDRIYQLVASIVSIIALVVMLYFDLADAAIIVPVLLAVIGGITAWESGRRTEKKRR